MKCDQCEMLSINGVPCHETGCPNARKQWDGEQWRAVFNCRECGCQNYVGDACTCDDQEEFPE